MKTAIRYITADQKGTFWQVYDIATSDADVTTLWAALQSGGSTPGYLPGPIVPVKAQKVSGADAAAILAGEVEVLAPYSQSDLAGRAIEVGSVLPGATPNPADGVVEGLGGGGTPAQVFVTKATLTAAQILNIATTPVDVVPAPGANKIIQPLGFFFDWTIAESFVLGGGFAMRFAYGGDATQAGFLANGWGDNQLGYDPGHYRICYPAEQGPGGLVTDYDVSNKALSLLQTGDNYTSGDATVTVYVTYSILDLS